MPHLSPLTWTSLYSLVAISFLNLTIKKNFFYGQKNFDFFIELPSHKTA